MEWRLDDSTITVKPGGMTVLRLSVDDDAVAEIPNSMNGRFAIPWKKRAVELRRVGPSRALESALYVDDELIPPSKRGPARSKKKAKCDAHGKPTGRRCPACETAVCPRCLSVDGVRCEACLEEAVASAKSKRKRVWWIGAAFCFAVAAFGAFAAATSGGEHWPKVVGTMLFGGGFMLWVGTRSYDEAKHPLVPVAFLVEGSVPQVAGGRCAACKERVGTAKAGTWCAVCRKVLHTGCADEHTCKPPRRGPDWDRFGREE